MSLLISCQKIPCIREDCGAGLPYLLLRLFKRLADEGKGNVAWGNQAQINFDRTGPFGGILLEKLCQVIFSERDDGY